MILSGWTAITPWNRLSNADPRERRVPERQNTPSEPVFPCTHCGACCRDLHLVDPSPPHDSTGRCHFLIDTVDQPSGRPVSVCSVYGSRAEHNCPTVNSLKPDDVSWRDYYTTVADGCLLLQGIYGLDESYRVKLPPNCEE